MNMLNPASSTFDLDLNHIEQLIEYPHLLGNLLGREKLTPIHSGWIRYVWDSYDEDRALQAHRGSYKTTSVLAIGAIRWMLIHPDDRIAIVRKTFTDAADVVGTIANLMEHPITKSLFKLLHGKAPRPVIRRYGQLTYDFKATYTPEGNVTAMGLDAKTGLHFDKILVDDFVTLKDRISKAERERTKEMVQEFAANIIDPGKAIGWLGTPWHREDAWNIIPVDMILKFPLSKMDLLSEAEIAKKRRSTTPFLFKANYELELGIDEGSLFADPKWGNWDYAVSNAQGQVDAAFDGDHYCALTIMAPKPNGRFQAIGFVYPGNIKDWVGFIEQQLARYKARQYHNETNPDKGWTASRIKYPVHTYTETMNKHNKVSTYLYDVWELIDWDPGTHPEYMNQILDYREGSEPDDAADSAASLIREAKYNKHFNIKSALWGE